MSHPSGAAPFSEPRFASGGGDGGSYGNSGSPDNAGRQGAPSRPAGNDDADVHPDLERLRRGPLSPSAKRFGTAVARVDKVVAYAADHLQTFRGSIEPCYLELVPLIWGIILLHGSHFRTLLVAIAAVRSFGWSRFRAAFVSLTASHQAACTAHDKDSDIPPPSASAAAPGDPGAARRRKREDSRASPVGPVEEHEVRRALFVTSSIKPSRLGDVFTGLTEALFALLAALRLHVTRCMALGVALGDVVDSTIGPAVNPLVQPHVPASISRWIPVVLHHGLRVAGLLLAMIPFMSSFLAGLYGAVLGASFIIEAGAAYLKRVKHLDQSLLDISSPKRAAAFALVVVIGLLVQLFLVRGLPLPIAILLFPLTLLERVLSMFAVW